MRRHARKDSSPLTDLMEYYDAEMTREEYILTSYLGEVRRDDLIPFDIEATFPEQFRRATLIETKCISDTAQ